MQPMDDNALLRLYSDHGSDDAFATLVSRHVNLVYSVALRQAGDPHRAEEITQAVFITLARKAARLVEVKTLSSWLFQTTRLTANNYIRSECRRHRREQEAHVQSMLNESGDDIWPKIAPFLDSAVAALNEKDRRAIVLRFYEGRTVREVGQGLETTEDAAEKRLSRAVEKLQDYFRKRGIQSTAAILAESMAAHSVQAAPGALAKSVTAAAMARTTAAAGAGLKLASVLTIAAVALVVGTGGYFLVWKKIHAHPAPASPPLAIVGVGLYLGRNQQTREFEVRKVFPNSPAEKAGLVPGLILYKVDNVLAETKNIKDLSKLLTGPVGSKVTVEMTDTNNGETKRVELLREQFLNRSPQTQTN